MLSRVSGVNTGRIKSTTADDMLQTKPLQDLLSQALSSTIHTAVIATPQGTLIANAINLPANLPSQAESARRKARSLGAIANVVWKNYANIKDVNELWDTLNGESVNERKEGLIWMSIECEVFSHLGCELICRRGSYYCTESPRYPKRDCYLLFRAPRTHRSA